MIAYNKLASKSGKIACSDASCGLAANSSTLSVFSGVRGTSGSMECVSGITAVAAAGIGAAGTDVS